MLAFINIHYSINLYNKIHSMYYINMLIYIIVSKSNGQVNYTLLFYSPISKYYSRVYTGAGGFQK